MKRIMIACVALAAFAAPALADQPDGVLWPFKTDLMTNGTWADGKQFDNTVAQGTAQIIQNGQFVSGHCDGCVAQTDGLKGRSDIVQGVQALDGRGRDK
jgi:hypothetical protein